MVAMTVGVGVVYVVCKCRLGNQLYWKRHDWLALPAPCMPQASNGNINECYGLSLIDLR